MEFASAVDAASCAIEIQRQIEKSDASDFEADLILFRILTGQKRRFCPPCDPGQRKGSTSDLVGFFHRHRDAVDTPDYRFL